MLDEFKSFVKGVKQTSRMMIGVPDYDYYVQHMKRTHPDQPIMTYEEFFVNRQNARYGIGGKGGFRCC